MSCFKSSIPAKNVRNLTFFHTEISKMFGFLYLLDDIGHMKFAR